MTRISRRTGTILLLTAGLTAAACGGPSEKSSTEGVGQLTLPLTTQGPSGATYRLRHATFVISSEYGYYNYGAGGEATSNGPITINSDDQPDAQSISVSLEQGYYYVQLAPGWSFEKDGPGGPVAVQATLLSSPTQWVSIAPHSTSWAEYQFGIGDRSIWLNGKLNIEIGVYEDPSQLYGGAGDTGFGGSPDVTPPSAGGAPDF